MGRPHLEDMIAFPRLPTKEPKKKTCTLSCIARYSCICLGKSIISNFGCLFHDPCTGTLLCGYTLRFTTGSKNFRICGRLKVYEVAVWQCFATPLKKGYKKNSHTTGAKKKQKTYPVALASQILHTRCPLHFYTRNLYILYTKRSNHVTNLFYQFVQ